jgi:hypothetical protein
VRDEMAHTSSFSVRFIVYLKLKKLSKTLVHDGDKSLPRDVEDSFDFSAKLYKGITATEEDNVAMASCIMVYMTELISSLVYMSISNEYMENLALTENVMWDVKYKADHKMTRV